MTCGNGNQPRDGEHLEVRTILPDPRHLPASFVRTVAEVHGDVGCEWVDRLPSLLATFAAKWSLTLKEPFIPLSYNYVAPATRRDGSEVVLKMGVPDLEFTSEIDALRFFDGDGAVMLIEADREHGAILLERLRPGTPLSCIDDEMATAVAGQVMGRLWKAVPERHEFLTVKRWANGLKRLRCRFDGGSGPLPERLVALAENHFHELIGSTEEVVLLHGDFHHRNIVAAQRQPWLALDPKGVVGEREYEISNFLRNPMPELLTWEHPGMVMARRADQLAEMLGLDHGRILRWGFAQAVLSAWWSLEDHGRGWEYAIACAELLAGLANAAG